jgi:hypothetical protein
MNVDRLKETIDMLLVAEEQYQIQQTLQQVRSELQQLVNQPQEAQFQTAFASSLDRLRNNVTQLRAGFTPAQWALFGEIGAVDLFLADVSQAIEKIMTDNPLTPAVTLNTVTELMNKRGEYLAALNELQSRLAQIGISAIALPPGDAEIGILLPRDLFQNHLHELSIELRVLNRILRAMAEIATGAVEPVEVHQISTTDPVFFLGMSVPTVVLVGKVIRWALDTWKQVEDIRKVRAETRKLTAFTEAEIKTIFETKVETVIRDAIETKVDELIPKAAEAGRLYELRVELAWALESILSRIERGMTAEIRFIPPSKSKDAAEEEYSQALQELAPRMSFPTPDPSPILRLPPTEPPSAAAN